jgi:hypothetical protein
MISMDISSFVACYGTALQWVYVAASLLEAERPSDIIPPPDILQEAVVGYCLYAFYTQTLHGVCVRLLTTRKHCLVLWFSTT